MLEELRYKDQDQQKLYNQAINNHVVKLIQNKTLPLNKQRYLHLQKINKTNAKQTSRTNPSTPQVLSPQMSFYVKEQLPSLKKSKSSKIYNQPTPNTLINRLKSIKELKSTSRLLSIDQMTSRCFQNLRATILANDKSERVSHSKNQSQRSMKISQGGHRQKEHLLQLSKKAEKYLRMKKHELKNKYCKQEELQMRKKPTPPSQIQLILTSFRKFEERKKTDANDSLQLQLLQDIRQTMFQEKVNRIKKDINHKKLVQLR